MNYQNQTFSTLLQSIIQAQFKAYPPIQTQFKTLITSMQTGLQKSNHPPQLSTLGTSYEKKRPKSSRKHFKVFSNLEQYLSSIQQIRLVDQLMRPISKKQKQQTLKRVNAVLLQIKEELDEIENLCRYFIGKEQMFVQAELITLNEWKSEIKKIDRIMNTLLDFINMNYTVFSTVFGLQTKIFNVGAKQWRRKCQNILKDPTCSCIKV